VFFKSDDNFKRLPTPQTARDVLVTWAYVALLMNILAAFAAYVIIEKFTNRPKVLGSHKWLFFFCEYDPCSSSSNAEYSQDGQTIHSARVFKFFCWSLQPHYRDSDIYMVSRITSM